MTLIRPSMRTLLSAVGLVVALVAGSASAASAQEQTLTVVRGNTLWDLAGAVYGNPYRWPVLYEANRDRIQDPDLIFPGQVLRIPQADGTVTEVVVAAVEIPAEETAAGEPVGRELPGEPVTGGPPGGSMSGSVNVFRPASGPERPVRASSASVLPAVSDDQVASAPFLIPRGQASPAVGRLVAFAGAEEIRATRSSARLYDRMIFESSAPFPAGTVLQAFRPGPEIPGVGQVAQPMGLLQVEPDVTGSRVASVRAQYGALRPGDLLRPVPSAGLPRGVEPVPVADGPRALIVGMADEHALYTVGDHVFLDVGAAATSVGDEWVTVWPTTARGSWEGRVQVVAVQADYATARIVNLVNPVFQPGITLQLQRRMPGR